MRSGDAVCPMCEWMMGWGWGTMLLVALFWVAVIGLIVWALYRYARSRGWLRPKAARATPQEILEERYARGEIGREEYLRMNQELKDTG